MSEQEKVNDWNTKHLPGVPVDLTKYQGEVVEAITESPAQIMGGRAVIWLEGAMGCYLLDCVKAQS